MRRCFVVGILLSALTGAHPAAAAESASVAYPGAGKFYGGVQVDVVNVEAFVTDADGRPVTGLGPEDFELLVDGRPVPIINFFAVQHDRPAGEGEDARSTIPASTPQTDRPPPEDQRLYLVLYVDNTAIHPSDRNRVFDHLEEMLARNVRPDDRVMVVTGNPHRQIRLSFTDPHERIPAVLDQLRHETSGGTFIRSEEQQILRAMKRMRTGQGMATLGADAQALTMDTRVEEARSILDSIHSHCRWRFESVVESVDALRQLMGSLSGLPGRKAVMYVGQGTAMRLGEPLFEAWVQRFAGMWSSVPNAPGDLIGLSALTEANRYNLRRYFQELVTHANASRVTFYAVDASQSASLEHVSAEQPGFPVAGNIAAMQVFGQEESLQVLADGTGGLHLVNLANVDRVVEHLAADFSRYYSLGFEPAGSADGRYHRIEVRVKLKNAKVRHRAGFRTKSLDEKMAERLLAALYLDISPNPLNVNLVQGDREPTADGRFRVPILVKIPLDRLVLLPQADEHHGRVTVWVAISDGSGQPPDIHGRRIPVRIPDARLDEALGQYVGYTVDLVVGKGPRRVALNVRDELASVNSTISFQLAPGTDTITVAAGS